MYLATRSRNLCNALDDMPTSSGFASTNTSVMDTTLWPARQGRAQHTSAIGGDRGIGRNALARISVRCGLLERDGDRPFAHHRPGVDRDVHEREDVVDREEEAVLQPDLDDGLR